MSKKKFRRIIEKEGLTYKFYKNYLYVESDKPFVDKKFQVIGNVRVSAKGVPRTEIVRGSSPNNKQPIIIKRTRLQKYAKSRFISVWGVDSDLVKTSIIEETIKYAKLIKYRDDKGRYLPYKKVAGNFKTTTKWAK